MKNLIAKIPYLFLQCIALIAIVLGCFIGKMLLSMGVIGLATCAILNPDVRQHFKILQIDRVGLWSAVVWLVYLASGLWSYNTNSLLHVLQLHLPLLVLPIGFAATKKISIDFFDALLAFFVFCAFIGTCYGAFHLFAAGENAIDLYRVGKSTVTPFKGDHVRFSLAIVMAILFSDYLMGKKFMQEKLPTNLRSLVLIVFWVLIVWFIVYLHLLAAKTGIICFYIFGIVKIISWTKKKNWKLALPSLFLLFFIPFIAWKFSPTFRMKTQYARYALESMTNRIDETNISDEGRIISYKLAWGIAKKNLLFGVGAGDYNDKMQQAYHDKIRGENVKVLLPHNQFLIMLLVGGIPALIVFILFIVAPVTTIPFRRFSLLKYFWIIIWIPLLVEPMHEAQISLTLHIFFLLLLNKLAQKTVIAAKE